jgi:hypothetical protein
MATTEKTEKSRGWTKSGSIYTYIVKDHGTVKFDRSKASAELLESFLDYGIGRIFPDRTSQLQGLAKLEGMRRLIAIAESGATSLTMTPAEKEAQAARQLRADLVEALKRIKGLDAAKADELIAQIGKLNGWLDEKQTVSYMANMADVKPIITKIREERRGERAAPGPAVNLEDVLKKLAM